MKKSLYATINDYCIEKTYIIIILAIVLNLSGAIIGKFIVNNLSNAILLFALVLSLILIYLARFKYWIWVGKRYQLTYIYPFISLSYVFSLFAGYYFFNENVSIYKIFGSIIIVLGVFTVSYSKNKRDEE
jgi:drug/metabolite transporter (DMT)-like permease